MDTPVRCAFCDELHPTKQLRREFELDFCERCAGGGAEAALRSRGHHITSREWTTRVRSQNSTYTLYHMSIDALPPQVLDVSATFTREHALHRLLKLFRREVEVGDALFDDFVYIRTPDPQQARALVGSTGVQSTLIDLVGRYETIGLQRGALQVRHFSTQELFAADAMLAACALLVHLERLATAQS